MSARENTTRAVTPVDDAEITEFSEVMVNVAGTLAVKTINGTLQPYPAVPAGVYISVGSCNVVMLTGTAATGILVR
ncbi:MAG: hypothetical protein GQ570_04030 [Helicobacteraceae bacterium]|nr:hypothetical protein [Helicobacteraceae bacterium]